MSKKPTVPAHRLQLFPPRGARGRVLSLLLGLCASIGLFFLWPLPPVLVLDEEASSVRVLDRHGALLYDVRTQEGLQNPLTLSNVPSQFLNALIAIEDRGFYHHPGVSPRGILRALTQNISARRVVSGGSTLTQQLVRIRLQPKSRTLAYKVREALLALKLDAWFSKEDILESYVNEAYFGHRAYGLTAAARTYFGKSPQELSLAESALLAGLPQSPSAYDPFSSRERATNRQQRVLTAMEDAGIITAEERTHAEEEPLVLTADRIAIEAPHFVFWLQDIRPEAFVGAGEVMTTLDLSLQRATERIVERKLEELADANVTAAAVVVLDARTGDILSMVGSADYFDEEYDGAVNVAVSPRQPGSALKPFTYALALAKGDTLATTVADVETQFFTQEGNPYIPRNYDYGYHGLVRYREALANSYNVAAVKVLERVGVTPLLHFLQSVGITTLTESADHYGLALTLGDGEVTLLELAQAFAIFPREGKTLRARVLLSDPVLEGEEILDPKIAWLITDTLSDQTARLPEFGADSPLSFDFPVAAKTGTTRNSRDNWTIGYTADRIVGVWVGNADNSPMRGTSGVTGAGPIFHDVMLAVAGENGGAGFPRPAGITVRTICRISGKLPTKACPQTVEELFIDGTEPSEPDDLYRMIRIDSRNGLLAGESCPPAFVRERAYAIFPRDTAIWARENGWPTPPMEYSPHCREGAVRVGEWIAIVQPHAGDSFRLDPLIPDANETIRFQAQADESIREAQWFVDGVRVGNAKAPGFSFSWQPTLGSHTVRIQARNLEDSRVIEVVE
ncbi:MAG: penicillin-binding protein 1C [Candidatus Peregrinibacteria bacterium]|nr:penicillin-binding protein 1C [Candidatus Peregrinibacteria bacterium]